MSCSIDLLLRATAVRTTASLHSCCNHNLQISEIAGVKLDKDVMLHPAGLEAVSTVAQCWSAGLKMLSHCLLRIHLQISKIAVWREAGHCSVSASTAGPELF
jgi:hypothetical protein